MIHGLSLFTISIPKKMTTKINKRIMLPLTLLTHLIPWMFILTGSAELISDSHSPRDPNSISSSPPLPSDVCANCKGDNSSCRVVAGIFTRPQLTVGYNVVAHIPRGACNLNISEIRISPNHLALRRKNGSYIFNGDWRLSQSGEYEGLPGTKFIYKRQDLRSLESITSEGGPLEEPVDLIVLFQQPNPGIKYEFTIPSSSWKESSLHPLVPLAQTQDPIILPSQSQTHHNHHQNGMKYYNSRRQSPLAATSRTASYISPALESSLSSTSSSSSSSSLQQLPQPILNLYNSVSSFPVKNANLPGGGASPDLYPAAGDLSSLSSFNSHNNNGANNNNNNNLNNLYNHHHHHHRNHLLRRRNHGGGNGNKHPVSGGGSGGGAVLPMSIDKKFYWKIAGYSNCSEPCGGGIQRSIVRCVRGTTGNGVSDRRCAGEEKPPAQMIRCNLKPCPAEWVIGEWSSCSANGECGQGLRSRSIHCQQRVSPKLTMRVAEGACLHQRPEATVSCELKPCNKWNTSEWSQCSTKCGNGIRKRTMKCVGASGDEVLAEECDQAEKPAALTPCNMGPCIGVSWFVSEWSSECSQKCGSGIQTRHVVCSGLHNHHNKNDTVSADHQQKHNKNQYYSYEHHQHSKNGSVILASELDTNLIEDNNNNELGENDDDLLLTTVVVEDDKMDDKILEANSARSVYQFEKEEKDDRDGGSGEDSSQSQYFCDESQKPQEERECFSDRGCVDPVWFTGDWGKCSSSCGSGIRTRQVLCVLFTRGRFKVVGNSGGGSGHYCSDDSKPIEKETCQSNKECEHRWLTTEWDECSALCGGGIQKRSVSCRGRNWTDISSLCSDEDRPIEKISCNEQKCTLTPVIVSSSTQSPQTTTSSSSTNIIIGNEIVKDEPALVGGEAVVVVEDDKKVENGTISSSSSSQKSSADDYQQHSVQQTSPVIEEVDEIECVDEYRNCALVVQARLCRYKYYRSVCCQSCSDAPV